MILQTCCFGCFGHAWPYYSKLIVSTYGKLCLPACKISTSYLTSFLRYGKDIAKLSRVLWACLVKSIKWENIKFQKNVSLSACKKSTASITFSWGISKILHTFYFEYFRHSGHTHSIWQYQQVENFDVYLHKRSTSYLTSFLKYCKYFANLLIWVHCPCPP